MLSVPVANRKIEEPTSVATLSRSSATAIELTGGRSNSFGKTDQSLTTRIGIAASRQRMCRPWVIE